MDIDKITPIIQQVIKETLEKKQYPFGLSKKTGISNKVASGKLRDSVQVKKVDRDGSFVIEVLMEEYWQWVQSGRAKGKKGVPVDVIEEWIKQRMITGRDKKGRFIKRRSFAFAIQQNIKKFGIKPSNFLDKAFASLENDNRIIELLGDEAYEDLINLIEGI